MTKCLKVGAVVVVLAGFVVAGCKAGGVTRGASETSDMAQALLGLSSLASAGSGLAGLTVSRGSTLKNSETEGPSCSVDGATTTCTCDNSEGSFTMGDGSMTFSSCEMGGDTLDGELSFTEENGTLNLSLTNFTAEGESGSFTISGTIAIGESSLEFNINGEFDGTAVEASGTLTLNQDQTVDGTLTVSSDEFSGSCTFDDLNPATATDSDYQDACTVSSATGS